MLCHPTSCSLPLLFPRFADKETDSGRDSNLFKATKQVCGQKEPKAHMGAGGSGGNQGAPVRKEQQGP